MPSPADSSTSATTVLDKRLSAKWDAAYVFLGSNYLGDQESYRKQLEKIVQRLSPSPVVLLTVTEFEDSRREVNDAITLVSAEFPNVHVLDWGSIAAADADDDLARRRLAPDQRWARRAGVDRRRRDGQGAGRRKASASAHRSATMPVPASTAATRRRNDRSASHRRTVKTANRDDGRRWRRYTDEPSPTVTVAADSTTGNHGRHADRRHHRRRPRTAGDTLVPPDTAGRPPGT